MMSFRRKKTKKRLFDLKGDIGLVFLIYRNETKRALLPNEVTSLDTIKALFVRAFCDQLHMRWFDAEGRKIYIMDQKTNVYYELEDLKDVKDRCVLKIYSPDTPGGLHSPSQSSTRESSHHGYESDSSVRSAPPMLPRSPMHVSHPPTQRPYSQEVAAKSASLPIQSNYAYPQKLQQQQQQQYGPPSHGPQPPGGWGSPTHSHRPMSQQISPLARHGQASPVRSPVHPNNRHSVAYMPLPLNHLAGGDGFNGNQLPQSRSYQDYPDQRSSGSVTPSIEDSETRERMQRMEAQLASLTAMVQTAVVLKGDGGNSSRPGSARSNSSLMSDASSSARSSKDAVLFDLPQIEPQPSAGSISQSDSATPIVRSPSLSSYQGSISQSDSATPIGRSPSLSSYQGISDGSTATPQPVFPVDVQNNMRALYQRARELRAEVYKLRRMQIKNNETMQETIQDTFKKIKTIIETVPGAQDQVVRSQRENANVVIHTYKEESCKVEKDLSDLASSVDDLRQDVLNKGCRINKDEIQTMALALSNVSKALGDLKARFPQMQDQMKTVMAGEMEVVVREEKYLKQQPDLLDEQLKKCEKLVKVLLTLKRLGSVQEARPVVAPQIYTMRSPDETDRRRLLEDIICMVPDHENRLTSVEATEAARERKKKITSNAESLRFEKCLEDAHKQLRVSNQQNVPQSQNVTEKGENTQDLKKTTSENNKLESPNSPSLPLTDTTKKLSMVPHGTTKIGKDNYINDNPSQIEKVRSTEDRVNLNSESIVVVQAAPKLTYDTEVSVKTQNNISVTQSPSINPDVSGSSSIQGHISRLSTFGMPAVTSTPNGEQITTSTTGHHDQHESGLLSPSTINKSINNGSAARGHVSFSSTVTEIPSPASPGKDGVKQKKIPPPPPPRKSSRLLSPSSKTDGLAVRPISPPTYENIENFKNSTSNKNSNNKSSNKPTSPPSRIPQIGSGQKPITRYQQELASGIYSNMNRPDLQEQKIKPAEVVKTILASHSEKDTNDKSGDNDSSDSSNGESQQNTVKRRPLSKENSPQPAEAAENAQIKDTSKRIPPPPPVRKTSALSQGGMESPSSQTGPTKLSPDGNSKIPKIGGGSYGAKKMTNGDVKNKSMTDKHYNETEIY